MGIVGCYWETWCRIKGVLMLYSHVLYHRDTLGVRDEVREGCCGCCVW